MNTATPQHLRQSKDNSKSKPSRFVIVAHTPLASALRTACMHVFEDAGQYVSAVDIHPGDGQEEGLQKLEAALQTDGVSQDEPSALVLLADIFGATPSNIAARYVEGLSPERMVQTRMLVGVNLPMLLRLLTYRHEAIGSMVQKAINGGVQSIMSVGASPRQNQTHQFNRNRGEHAAANHHHQQ